MSKIGNFISGTYVLEEVNSPVNGQVAVIKSLAFGTYIQVANLTQSGGIIYDVWKKSLKRAKSRDLKVQSCLIVGLGGGTVAKLVKKIWPDAKITGVDIDPIMVDLGKKYLGMDANIVGIEIGDGFKFVQEKVSKKKKYDLVLIDTYVGDSFPEKFESDEFLENVKKILSGNGVAIFNRLYYGEKRPKAVKFNTKLEKIFQSVEVVYPEANIMFICQ